VALQEAVDRRTRQNVPRHHAFVLQQLLQHVERATRVLPLGGREPLLHGGADLGLAVIATLLRRQARKSFPAITIEPDLECFLSDLPAPRAGMSYSLLASSRSIACSSREASRCG